MMSFLSFIPISRSFLPSFHSSLLTLRDKRPVDGLRYQLHIQEIEHSRWSFTFSPTKSDLLLIPFSPFLFQSWVLSLFQLHGTVTETLAAIFIHYLQCLGRWQSFRFTERIQWTLAYVARFVTIFILPRFQQLSFPRYQINWLLRS